MTAVSVRGGEQFMAFAEPGRPQGERQRSSDAVAALGQRPRHVRVLRHAQGGQVKLDLTDNRGAGSGARRARLDPQAALFGLHDRTVVRVVHGQVEGQRRLLPIKTDRGQARYRSKLRYHVVIAVLKHDAEFFRHGRVKRDGGGQHLELQTRKRSR